MYQQGSVDVDGLQHLQRSVIHVMSLLAFLNRRIIFHDAPVVSDGHHGGARFARLGRHTSFLLCNYLRYVVDRAPLSSRSDEPEG